MELNDKALQKLLRLKKLETPGRAYFDAFLDEFHRYQRADLIQKSSWLENVTESIRQVFALEPRKVLAWGGSFALVVLLVTLGMNGTWSRGGLNTALASTHVVPAAASQGYVEPEAAPASQPDLQLVSASAFEKDFSSPRYVTGQTPLSYEKAFAF